MTERKPCPGCDAPIPIAWKVCRSRACYDARLLASRSVSTDSRLRAIADQTRQRNRERELAMLIEQQMTETRHPHASTYRHYMRHLAGGGSVSLDARLTNSERSGYDVRTHKPGRLQLEWWDPTYDAVEALLDIEERIMDAVRPQGQAERVDLLPWDDDPGIEAGVVISNNASMARRGHSTKQKQKVARPGGHRTSRKPKAAA